jgi:ATP/maltotriose-dependent transcriptional regulator MalT
MTSESTEALAARADEAFRSGDVAQLERAGRALVDRCLQTQELDALAKGYNSLGNACFFRGDADGAESFYRETLRIRREQGNELMAALALMNIASVARDLRGQVVEARTLYDTSVPIVREDGTPHQKAVLFANLAELSRAEGDYDSALYEAGMSSDFFNEIGNTAAAGWQLSFVALVRALRHDFDSATALLRTSFEMLRDGGHPQWLASLLDVCFAVAVMTKRYTDAAKLAGFTDRFRNENRAPRRIAGMAWYAKCIEDFVAKLGVEQEQALRAEGDWLSFDDASKLAQRHDDSNVP